MLDMDDPANRAGFELAKLKDARGVNRSLHSTNQRVLLFWKATPSYLRLPFLTRTQQLLRRNLRFSNFHLNQTLDFLLDNLMYCIHYLRWHHF